ncbi:aminopeptidase B [Aplysia californica]|uniref:Aminopeptidase B n=1 Tax=Aplysia californica TaxID=6500 RepID=A0ABM1A276_APLCA|nr:aminopeptidase B [Aplysia californica]XP_012939330.1 aminopeptidase B [Aplysia californica]XP_012939331.1 aminopeptidase B [Aplysia californica]XP_012939333.1 aminopeptidase B [Aplysia californica]
MGLHADSAEDPATASNFREAVSSHLHLDVDVDFDTQTISGVNRISMECLTDGLKQVILDVHEALTIKKVTTQRTRDVDFKIEPFDIYGQSLVLTFPQAFAKNEKFDVEIEFVTSPSPGVCWLEPPQTTDKKLPLMYTQGQAVLNRSFFPCQDTPAIKVTFSANVKVPDGFTPLMSANKMSTGEKPNRKGETDCFFFEQEVPIPVYLVAMAVGDFVSAEIGPRSKVWAERSMLDKAAAELRGDVEEFLLAGEQLFGEYVWTKYDILVMPPSFPFGGMENPCLTFITPCNIVGDKSQNKVVIHEISHSWFGNLVTNASWSDFWLNEGFTMYAQRRIEEKMYGKAYMCLEAATGQALLNRHIDREGTDHPLTKLRVVIDRGVDPDDTYNETPYEKGFCFLSYLCSLVGSVEVFDVFLKAYVDKFKYKSVLSEDFFDFFLEYFPRLRDEKVDEKPGLEFVATWLNKPGRSPYCPDLSDKKELTAEAERAAEIICDGRRKGSEAPDMSLWKAYSVLYFLDEVASKSPLPAGCMKKLADTYPFLSASHNSEILLRWCEVVIKNDAGNFFQDVRSFMKSQGKLKYTKPLYSEMTRGSDAVRHLAVEIFRETRESLHVQVREYVASLLKDAGLLV